ncbi:hypothetical protein BGZ76_001573 [Entomortierella beljakovae]|nr:hypothetical protein BGZ76_001573 [Entomortierella beljakovae]
MTDILSFTNNHPCSVCRSKDQQILVKDQVIKAKDEVIAAKDEAIAQKDEALKYEREFREQLQKQINKITGVVGEEKDALTIYVRNVTERMTYDMLHNAFSTFGTIRTLNMLYPKACAFVEFSAPDAYQRALAAATVSVGDGSDKVITEKRVRRPQQSFVRRPSRETLKSVPESTPTTNTSSTPLNAFNNIYSCSNNSSSSSINSVESTGFSRDYSDSDIHIKYQGGKYRILEVAIGLGAIVGAIYSNEKSKRDVNRRSGNPTVDTSTRYDYAILGGETVGRVLASRLASRLAEDIEVNILILIAGQLKTDPDWNFSTIPQTHAKGHKINQPQGILLGGSSSLNAMMHYHGPASDCELWSIFRNPGWTYDE